MRWYIWAGIGVVVITGSMLINSLIDVKDALRREREAQQQSAPPGKCTETIGGILVCRGSTVFMNASPETILPSDALNQAIVYAAIAANDPKLDRVWIEPHQVNELDKACKPTGAPVKEQNVYEDKENHVFYAICGRTR
jgi:hypothetical protein